MARPTIILGADHGGFEMKRQLIEHLQTQGYPIIDAGAYSAGASDYPIYGF